MKLRLVTPVSFGAEEPTGRRRRRRQDPNSRRRDERRQPRHQSPSQPRQRDERQAARRQAAPSQRTARPAVQVMQPSTPGSPQGGWAPMGQLSANVRIQAREGVRAITIKLQDKAGVPIYLVAEIPASKLKGVVASKLGPWMEKQVMRLLGGGSSPSGQQAAPQAAAPSQAADELDVVMEAPDVSEMPAVEEADVEMEGFFGCEPRHGYDRWGSRR